ISRGEDVEITTYLNQAVMSELSANVIDLCPVGALTSKPYAFNARSWELTKTESVDVMDGIGSAIRIDSRGPAVLRILPRVNDDVNEEWISDKTRYACDGLTRQRLDRPMLRRGRKLEPTDWSGALAEVAARLAKADPARIGVIAGDLQDAESMKAALDLFIGLGVANLDCRPAGLPLGEGPRQSWLFNSTLAGLERSDAVLLVGTNPRLEASVLNARLRKMWLAGRTRFGLVGEAADLTFAYDHLGVRGSDLDEALGGKSDFAKAFASAEQPAIILGEGALARKDGAAVLQKVAALAGRGKLIREGWNGWNVLHAAAARVGGLDLGFVPKKDGLAAAEMLREDALEVLFLLGADEHDLSGTSAFVVYLGSHGDRGAQRADAILPAAAWTEKKGLYVNTEGRVQRGERAVFPKGEAKEDWAILRALSERVGERLPYDGLDELRERLFAEHPSFGQIGYAPGQTPERFELKGLGAKGRIGEAPLASPISRFHLTNPIARSSPTMAECAALFDRAKMAAE
ncbi:MAG: molybdopterin-dependent oxidoreductase, partial [Caulobacteraceae bacterium]